MIRKTAFILITDTAHWSCSCNRCSRFHCLHSFRLPPCDVCGHFLKFICLSSPSSPHPPPLCLFVCLSSFVVVGFFVFWLLLLLGSLYAGFVVAGFFVCWFCCCWVLCMLVFVVVVGFFVCWLLLLLSLLQRLGYRQLPRTDKLKHIVCNVDRCKYTLTSKTQLTHLQT